MEDQLLALSKEERKKDRATKFFSRMIGKPDLSAIAYGEETSKRRAVLPNISRKCRLIHISSP